MIELITYYLIGFLLGASGFRDLRFYVHEVESPLARKLVLIGSLGQIACGLALIVLALSGGVSEL